MGSLKSHTPPEERETFTDIIDDARIQFPYSILTGNQYAKTDQNVPKEA